MQNFSMLHFSALLMAATLMLPVPAHAQFASGCGAQYTPASGNSQSSCTCTCTSWVTGTTTIGSTNNTTCAGCNGYCSGKVWNYNEANGTKYKFFNEACVDSTL